MSYTPKTWPWWGDKEVRNYEFQMEHLFLNYQRARRGDYWSDSDGKIRRDKPDGKPDINLRAYEIAREFVRDGKRNFKQLLPRLIQQKRRLHTLTVRYLIAVFKWRAGERRKQAEEALAEAERMDAMVNQLLAGDVRDVTPAEPPAICSSMSPEESINVDE